MTLMLLLLFSDHEKDLLICNVLTEINMRELIVPKLEHEHKSEDIFSEDFPRSSDYSVAVLFSYLSICLNISAI